MPDTAALMRQKLQSCDLCSLFIDDLGWNHHRASPLIFQIDGTDYILNAISEKHGMVAYECQPDGRGQIPDYPIRGKIERQVTKSAHEHVIVFVNAERTTQTWQWVRREKDRPTARREHTYVSTQTGDLLIQKLQNLMISLDEEEKLTIVDVTGKVRQAFDVDQVTKRFFDSFKREHDAFLTFIEGITGEANRDWYASLMLNRLMFIYFIQKKGFLDGDIHYLRNRLEIVRQSQGKGKFHTFYRYFLRRLFHEGLAQHKDNRSAELNSLLGNVPYLNGGLFDVHQLENDNPEVNIPDEAFERLFNFFDAYEWHLDYRIVRKGNEINPDVLGYIFEKYINQKQMGAYYTKEDITEYISKSTIIPFLFDAAEKKCAIAFRREGAVWRLLRDDPDRYIFDLVEKGVDLPLPEDIAAGIADVTKRGCWNRPADEPFGLPTETWREHVARRTHCLEVKGKLESGEIHNINDLVTFNLDVRQFAQDVIETCEGPGLLRAFYESLKDISILDPTCGSGAFLFAALNILEPLYEACLERMDAFVNEMDKSREKHHPEKFSDFRKVLGHANDRTKHPSERYFVLKSIVLRNLYGVDIMAEAVEICKLRLFLKLVAQVERVEDVEPLPDIDFNIRTGNSLVGFTSLKAIRQVMTMGLNGQQRMLSPEDQDALQRIDESAEMTDRAFRLFREQQTDSGIQVNSYLGAKNDLRIWLGELRTELDRYLATEYGIDTKRNAPFETWRSNHQPFHWLVEFYGIMHGGGFDAIIGNPPFVEFPKVRDKYEIKNYETQTCNNLYAFVAERAKHLLRSKGRIGLIFPNSSVSAIKMQPLRNTLCKNTQTWISNFAWRPSKLFEASNMLLAIWLIENDADTQCYSTRYLRWYRKFREYLFPNIEYTYVENGNGRIPKSPNMIIRDIFDKCNKTSNGKTLLNKTTSSISRGYGLYYFRAVLYWIKVLIKPPVFLEGEEEKQTGEMKELKFIDRVTRDVAVALLSSNLFSLYYVVWSSCQVLNAIDFEFPVDMDALAKEYGAPLSKLSQSLLADYESNSTIQERHYSARGREFIMKKQYFYLKESKPIIDEIDRILANYYGFTQNELDFITNYDIKYRMGTDSDAEDG